MDSTVVFASPEYNQSLCLFLFYVHHLLRFSQPTRCQEIHNEQQYWKMCGSHMLHNLIPTITRPRSALHFLLSTCNRVISFSAITSFSLINLTASAILTDVLSASCNYDMTKHVNVFLSPTIESVLFNSNIRLPAHLIAESSTRNVS